MKSRLPTTSEIEQLVSFLPKLTAEGLEPIIRWDGGDRLPDGAITLSWPVYHEDVEQFFLLAASDFWSDYEYEPANAADMLEKPGLIEGADLAQIKTMLTFAVRGERFCDGHWATMIEKKLIRRLLERLREILREEG